MLKNRFIFCLLSSLYILFVANADLYSKPKVDITPPTCCMEETEESCCGKELNDGKCQSTSCCHTSTGQAQTSISLHNSKIELSQSKFIKEFLPVVSDFFKSNFYNFSTDKIRTFFYHTYATISLLQHYLAFINTWKC